MPDPLKTLWNALDAQGYDPQGPEYHFRANCPAHDGDSHQLKVDIGADGRALVWCHTNQCPASAVVSSLGLDLSDLYPDGHDRAKTLEPPKDLRTEGMATKVMRLLASLDEVQEPWLFMILVSCQFCGAGHAWVRGASDGVMSVDCSEGCSERAFTQGLTGRVQLARADAEVTKRRSRAF